MLKFKALIPFGVAANIVLFLSIIVIFFHILVIVKLVPLNVIWGGRLETEEEMYVFEAVSIAINLLLAVVVLSKKRAVNSGSTHKATDILLWIYVALFSLNTFANLAAKASVETLVGTPLTFLLAVLCYRLAIESNPGKNI